MTTIEEILKPFQSDNMIVKIIKAKQLENQFNSLAKSNPQFGFFVYLVNHYCRKYIFPEDVLTLCDLLHIITIDDLIEWSKSANGNVIMPIIDPYPDVKLYGKKSIQKLKGIVTSICDCESTCKWNFGDSDYYLINEDDLKKILAKCPINKRDYVTSIFDCEDFARTTKCWCTLHGLGNIAFAYAEVNFYNSDKFLFAHGINLIPLSDERVVFVEPQSDRIWPADKPEFGFGADEMKLRFVQF